MIKIYTPKSWYSYFGKYPEIIIDNDLIFSEEGFYKFPKEPTGKIDTESGLIYGEDYYKINAQPIGKMKNNDGETIIYGDDYYKIGAKPILYIKDNKAYTYDAYFKLFREPTAFIEPDDEERKEAAPQDRKQPNSQGSGFSAGGFALILLAVFCIAGAYGWIGGSWFDFYSKSELALFFVPVIITGIVAFFATEGFSVILFMVLVSGVLSWIAAMIYDLVREGFSITWILADLLLGWLVTIPSCFLPALVVGILIIIVQHLIAMLK